MIVKKKLMRLTSFFILVVFAAHSQTVLKENLSVKHNEYWDFNRTQLQSTGCFYKDEVEETTQKHGKWLYYDRLGVLEEERNYYKDLLHGKAVLYYPNKKLKQEGYFFLDHQDSIYREWNETAN